MKHMKRGLSLLLVMLMLASCLPVMAFAAVSSDYSAKVTVERSAEASYNGQDVAKVSFVVNANGKNVGNVSSMLIAYDTSVFELLNKGGKKQNVTPDTWSNNIGNAIGIYTYEDENYNQFTAGGTACLSDDGKTGYLAIQPMLTAMGTPISVDTALMSVNFGLVDGNSWDAIPSNAIRLATTDERNALNQPNIAGVNDGDKTTYVYATKIGEDTLAKPEIEAVGYTPVKPNYAGTEAAAPEVDSKKGGDVTLKAQTVDGETVEYAYGTTNTVPTSGWQDSASFTGLAVGTYYFFARVKETADHQVGAAVVSDAVTVYAAPTISYADDALASLKVGQSVSVSPTVNGGAPELTYSAEGLPAGLSIDGGSGVISGAPATTTAEGGSATVTVTDAEGQTGTATVTWGKVSGQSLSNSNFTYTEVSKIYDKQPATATVTYAGGITDGEAGTLTVYYQGTGGTDYAKTDVAPTDAGTYSVIAQTTGGTKYEPCEVTVGTLTIQQKTIAVLEITILDKTYDGTTEAKVASISFDLGNDNGPLPGDDVSIPMSGITAAFNDANVGEDKPVTITGGLVLTGADAGNYTLEEFTESVTGTITTADYTPSNTATQSVVVGVGTFTEPTFPGVNGETVDGTLSYTYNDTPNMTYDAVVAELAKLAKGATATINWSFTATNGNYVSTAKTDTINVTMVDIIFQVNGETATVANALTVKEAPVYGDTWDDIVKITGNISASVDKTPVNGTYALDVSGRPDAGNDLAYKVIFNATDNTQYQDVEVLSGTVDVAQLEAVLTWSGDTGLVYNGDAKNVTATVSNLMDDDSCTVTVENGTQTNAGTYTATAVSLSNANYKLPAETTREYSIAPKVTDLTVTVEPAEFEYSGSVQQPTVTVKDGENVLTVAQDYTVSMEDSTDVGTYTVTVTGAGNYAGSKGTATYEITKVSQAAVSIGQIDAKTYGDADFTITVSGGSGEGAYSLTSSDPTILSLVKGEADGQWTATIHKAGDVTLTAGKAEDDNYKPAAEVTMELEIQTKALVADEVTLEANYNPTYTGEAFTPSVTVKDGDKTLVKDTDYEVAYEDNINAGTATVTVTGKGNYTDSVEKTFTIAKASLAEMKPTIVGDAQVGSVLTAKLADVASDEYVWHWYYKVDGDPDYVEITAAEGKASFVVTSDLSNKEIYAEAAAVTDGNYQDVTLSSDPVTVAKQAITGTVTILAPAGAPIAEGTELTANASVMPAAVALNHQWYVGGTAVEENGTGSTYTVQAADAGKNITVSVEPADAAYTGSITSAPVAVGKTMVDAALSITVNTEDKTVTAEVTIGDEIVVDFVIHWLRNGVDTGMVGETYALTSADNGAEIVAKAEVQASEEYTGELISNAENIDATVPAAPSVNTSVGNGQVTLSWNVADNGGKPVTGYTVTYGEKNGATQTMTLDAATTSYSFTGLTNDIAYTFSVSATNEAGSSTPTSVEATPTAGGGGGGSIGGGTVTVTSQYTITVKQTEGGKIAPETVKVEKGKDQSFTITADAGYVLKDVLVDGKSVGVVTSYTFEKVSANHTIQAVFEKQPFQFADVDPNGWAAPYIYDLYDRGMVDGVGGNLFAPTRSITRAEFVKLLAGAAGVKAEDLSKDASTFTDVEHGSWYEPYVVWAVENEVATGTSATTFAPTALITRQEMATMLYRFAVNTGVELPKTAETAAFADADSIADWAAEAVTAIQQAGIIDGIGGNLFAPTDNATREQACKVLVVFLEITEK